MIRALAALVVVGVVLTAAPASANPRTDRAENRVACPARWQRGPWAVERLVRCEAQLFGVSSSTAMYVARRESRFHPAARNPYSGACGIFQHMPRYWPGRVATYARDWAYRGPWVRSCFNARTNVVTSMAMVRAGGWGPWSVKEVTA